MKHYLLTPEGLKRITDKDVETWRLQGGFMKTEGPVMLPVALGQPDVECIELLLEGTENFVYWFTPDFRVAFTTKKGLSERGWKLRFELRGTGKDGKAGTQSLRIDGKIRSDGVIKVIAEVFLSMGKKYGAPPPSSEAVTVTDDQVVASVASAT
jgi:hypothetical protein